jgi:O-antigen/teichoic acid export membrane protein
LYPRALSRLSSSSGLAYAASGQIVAAASALVSVRVYTGLLEKDEFGLAMVAMGAVAFLDGIVTMAFNQTLLSLCAQAKDGAAQRRISIVLGWRLGWALGWILAPLTFATLAAGLFMKLPPIVLYGPALASLYLCEEICKTTILSPIMARREYSRYSLWTASESVATLTLTTLVLWLARAYAFGFLLGMLVSRWATTVAFTSFYAGGAYFEGASEPPSAELLAKAISYGGPVSAMAPLGWIGAYLDRFAVTTVGGLSSAGVYSAVGGLVGRPYAITTAILTNYFRPLLFHHDAGEDPHAAKMSYLRQWLLAAAGVGLAGAGAMAALSKPIVSLALAPDYRAGAAQVMIVLGLAQTFSIMTHAADNAILSTGASARLLRLQIWVVLAALFFVPLGTWLDGGLGAAMGRLAAELLKFCATFALTRHLIRPQIRAGALVVGS